MRYTSATHKKATLNAEWHARPDMRLKPSMRCTHIVTSRETSTHTDVLDFCTNKGTNRPIPDARHHLIDLPNCMVKWENHTEAASYTFAAAASKNGPFSEPSLSYIPSEVQNILMDNFKVGVRIEMLPEREVNSDKGFFAAQTILKTQKIYGGWMSDQHAAVWSDFLPDTEGFIRILIADIALTEGRLSRLVHRLLDMETYRILAITALPLARKTMEKLDQIEPELDTVMETLASNPPEEKQEDLLNKITNIAARAEHLASSTAYRFAAAKAYEDIVLRRMKEVREDVLDGHLRFTVFLNKTLRPAMRTCDAAELRAQTLTARVSRAANLLNTMVDMTQNRQSHEILRSLEKQAGTQVKLQQAVEGFSIFAVSYYALGLIGYTLKAAQKTGVAISPDLISGLLAPAIVFLSWMLVRTVKRRVIPSKHLIQKKKLKKK